MKVDLKFFRKVIGSLEVYKKTAQSYVGFASFLMILIGWIKFMGFEWYITVIICYYAFILLSVIVFLHVTFIMPNEFQFYNKKNPATVTILADLKKIKKGLKID